MVPGTYKIRAVVSNMYVCHYKINTPLLITTSDYAGNYGSSYCNSVDMPTSIFISVRA